jgi:hypothetical protein
MSAAAAPPSTDDAGLSTELLALLSLLPPDGATRVTVLGDDRGQPDAALKSPDLIVLAPGILDCCRPAFWRRAVREARRLGPNGIAYVLAPPAARTLLCATLAWTGLRVSEHLLHRPGFKATSRVLPLRGQPGGRAGVARALALGTRIQRLFARAVRLPGVAAVAGAALPSVGVALRRRGTGALAAWLFTGGVRPGPISLTVNPRGLSAGIVAFGWSAGEPAPSRIAKLTRGDAQRLHREASALRELGPHAARAGARVPKVLAERSVGQAGCMIVDALPGTAARDLLRGHPERVEPVLHRLADWLDRWQRATTVPARLSDRRLDEILLGPARALSPSLARGAEYERRLAALAGRAHHEVMPLVATHADLTMVNVLWSQAGLAVVDWATAEAEGVPLTDLFYASVDAVYAATGGERAQALSDCFAPSGERRRLVGAMSERLREGLGMSQVAATVALHACFLHHAHNEHRRAPAGPRPFLATLERLTQIDQPAGWGA